MNIKKKLGLLYDSLGQRSSPTKRCLDCLRGTPSGIRINNRKLSHLVKGFTASDALLIVVFVFLAVAAQRSVAAQPIPDVTQTVRRQLQDMQGQWQEQQQESRRDSLQQPSPNGASPSVPTDGRTTCLRWESVEIRGLDLLSAARKRTLLDLVPTGCLTAQNLGELTRQIAAMFLQEGYFRINVDQDQLDRKLIWTVRPAKVAAIRNATSLNTSSLFPSLMGKPANVHDLDQGLEQANRLPGHQVTMDVYPDHNGDVIISLKDTPTGAVHGLIGWNDFGPDSTGRSQVDGQILVSNPTGLADSLAINATSSLHTDPSRYSRSAGGLYSIPFGHWTFSALGGLSVYRTLAELPLYTIRLDGNSWFAGVRGEYVFSRDSSHISSAYSQLTREVVVSKFLRTVVPIQSPSLTTLGVGLNHTALIGSNVLAANLEYKQGLSWLGSDKDASANGLPASEFKKVTTSLSWTHSLRAYGKTIRFDQVLAAQYSADRLPSIEQLGITDRNSVRGFPNTYLTGDYGFYLHQTASTPLSFASGALRPYLALDTGRARQHGGEWQGAVSSTIGITFDRKPWLTDIALSKGRTFAQLGVDHWDTELMAQVHATF
ncbi:ShlB/FhaC/HecB family hemolysin secretion/activation protein [Paraburkholderia caribensis]|uniref:ShlB/FhaC/HecB family hemolysin secretion/activation protein n=1 Tax=Paraburkholderia caribensis TaxID=75105 RepID=UPI0034D1ED35